MFALYKMYMNATEKLFKRVSGILAENLDYINLWSPIYIVLPKI